MSSLNHFADLCINNLLSYILATAMGNQMSYMQTI